MAPPSLPSPDKDLFAVGVKSSKATIKGKGDRKTCEDVWFQVFDIDIKALITSFNATIKFKAKI